MKKLIILFSVVIALLSFIFFNITFRKRVDYNVHGIDISHYQKDVDFKEVVNDGFSFVFMKATEGKHIKDHHFDKNWKAAHQEGIIKSAYHFYRPKVDPYAQVDWFVKHVKLGKGDLPPVLDVETFDGVPIDTIRENVSIWLNLIEKKYGIRPIIYTNHSFYHDVFYNRKAFEKYPIWIAAYGKVFKPILKDERKDWSMWQYTDRGNSRGIEGDVDLNVFHGTIEDLKRMCIPGKYEVEDLKIHIPKSLPKVGYSK
ncbi:glycoside hydrolase family 25 protein [Flammeovirga sp. OC4]|uniref:glycoside hydrolase family 25 protein n=1 Tax=Flammeovirga sp. OC4 TaxID=1382345 RepID=UPI00155DAB43|nr:GH25 family lysozyme [Flammeovirga sp. OC4]